MKGKSITSPVVRSMLPAGIPRGVTVRPSGKWQAQFYYRGKSRYAGVFDTAKEASIAYEILRKELEATKQSRNDAQDHDALFNAARMKAIETVKNTVASASATCTQDSSVPTLPKTNALTAQMVRKLPAQNQEAVQLKAIDTTKNAAASASATFTQDSSVPTLPKTKTNALTAEMVRKLPAQNQKAVQLRAIDTAKNAAANASATCTQDSSVPALPKTKAPAAQMVRKLPAQNQEAVQLSRGSARFNLEAQILGIDKYHPHDILFGREGAPNKAARIYHEVCERNKGRYAAATRSKKLLIAAAIVGAVRSHGGRFLERNKGGQLWYEVTKKRAIDKTGQVLRRKVQASILLPTDVIPEDFAHLLVDEETEGIWLRAAKQVAAAPPAPKPRGRKRKASDAPPHESLEMPGDGWNQHSGGTGKKHPKYIYPTPNGQWVVRLKGFYLGSFYSLEEALAERDAAISVTRRDNESLKVFKKARDQARRINSGTGKGIYHAKATGKWEAQASVKGKVRNIGTFPSPEEASRAYATVKKALDESGLSRQDDAALEVFKKARDQARASLPVKKSFLNWNDISAAASDRLTATLEFTSASQHDELRIHHH